MVSVPAPLLAAPYASFADPPVTLPVMVSVPVLPLYAPCAFALPPVTLPLTVTALTPVPVCVEVRQVVVPP